MKYRNFTVERPSEVGTSTPGQWSKLTTKRRDRSPHCSRPSPWGGPAVHVTLSPRVSRMAQGERMAVCVAQRPGSCEESAHMASPVVSLSMRTGTGPGTGAP